jgi:hypothetical protein
MPSDFDLLRPLDTEPRSPSTVDVRRAIADGHRRKVRRGAGYAGIALTFVAVSGVTIAGGVLEHTPTGPSTPGVEVAASKGSSKAAPAVPAPTSCTVEQLPIPNDIPKALIAGADPSGRYFVGRSYPKDGYQAVIWHNGVGAEVPLPGDREEELTDVNASGTAVGWSYDNDDSVPFVYHDGKVSQLSGVTHGAAAAINGSGAIVGDDGAHPVFWSSPTAEARLLPVPAGSGPAEASDIDEDGTVVGTIDNKTPYVWLPDGSHHALKLPDLGGDPLEGRVRNISGGWVTGVVNEAGPDKAASGRNKAAGQAKAVRWNVRTGEVVVVDQLDKYADAVNPLGWQVGIGTQGRPVLVAGKTTVQLPGIADHPAGNLTDIPATLSNDGHVIGGQSDDAGDVIKPVVWRCK